MPYSGRKAYPKAIIVSEAPYKFYFLPLQFDWREVRSIEDGCTLVFVPCDCNISVWRNGNVCEVVVARFAENFGLLAGFVVASKVLGRGYLYSIVVCCRLQIAYAGLLCVAID